MAKWNAELDIKRFLNEVEDEDVADEMIHRVAGDMAGALTRFMASKRSEAVNTDELETIRDEFGILATGCSDEMGSLQEAFNEMLDNLYDWGDVNRVWLGL